MKKQTINAIITHLLRAAFFLVLLVLAIHVIPGVLGQPMSKEALKAEAAAKTDVALPNEDVPLPSTPTVCTLDGTLGTAPPGGTTGTLATRLFRGGVVTTCASAPYPGTTGTGPFIHNVHNITNPNAAPLCTNVTLHYVSGGTATVNIQVAAFQSPFAPADISNAARYLGDPGLSSGAPPGTDQSFAVNVPASATIALVVFNTNVSPAGQDAVYQLNLDQDAFCGPPAPSIQPAGSTITAEGCAPSNSAIDPGETVTVDLKLMNNGGAATTNLVATLVAGGGVTSPSGPQNYGVIAPLGMTTRSFSFTADSALACGANITATLQLSDNGNPLPPVTFSFATGVFVGSFSENFDGVAAPALPVGWTTTFSGSGTAVTTSTIFPDTAPNDIFLSEASTVGLSEVTSATIALPASSVSRATFRNLHNTEANFDGKVLEISVNGGAFQDILAAGGTFVSGGYNSTMPTTFMNPLPGRMAWSGLSGGTAAAPAYITTVVDLPAAAAGQNIQLKWIQGSDSTVAPATNPGSRIDTVSIANPVCCGGAPVPSSAVSRKMHGGLGPFNVPLPLVAIGGAVGIEDRTGPVAGEHQMVVTFPGPVTVGSVSVTNGTGSATFSGSGTAVITINLTGVTNAQRLGVTLTNVNNGTATGNVFVPMGVLSGDTNGNGSVNAGDVGQTKGQSGAVVGAGNFRTDVNSNGAINAGDVSVVKSRSGTNLPP